MWQEVIVGLIVLLALAFLVRHYFFGKKKTGACGGCSGCSNKPSCHDR